MLVPFGVCLVGALGAAAMPRLTALPYCATLTAALATCLLAWWGLSGPPMRLVLADATTYAPLTFRVDSLASFFLLMIGALTAAVSVYAFGYVDRRHYGGAPTGAAFCVFIAAMVGVILAGDVFTFMLLWELMALSSFVLVMHDHSLAEVRRAGFIYFAMSHAGAGFLLVGFMLLAGASGTLAFDGLRIAGDRLAPLMRDGAFLLFLVGFAVKSGVIPLHVWLPRAHPAAPSHVSAMMSGVMIKTAVYGLIRVSTELLGPMPLWWGWTLLALGVVSAVLGVLYALMEHDLKRLLAYSSVENIGIILVGVGAGFVLAAQGAPTAAALALSAALFHALNHTLFKGLLFLGAGAVQRAAGTRDLERLGGLIHAMPWTAAAFLAGAMAISALPPLNGFASEWLTFQALLAVAARGDGFTALGVGGVVSGLALTGGLAAFTFIKAFGVGFLGVPRVPHPAPPREAPIAMVLSMVTLALACVALGLFPAVATDLATRVASDTLTHGASAMAQALPAPSTAVYVPLGILVVLVAGAALIAVVVRLVLGAAGERIIPPWVCGVALEPRMQYSASALAKPIRIIFQPLLRSHRQAELRHAHAEYFVTEVHYQGHLRPVYEAYLYRPLVAMLVRGAGVVRRLQNGSLRLYVSYVFATLIVVLILSR